MPKRYGVRTHSSRRRCKRPFVLGVGDSILQDLGEAVAVEDVVAQDHCAAVVADELFTEDESLSQAVRGRLDLILQMDAVLAAIAQQRLEAGVSVGSDDEDVLDAAA